MRKHTPGPWMAEMKTPPGGQWPAKVCELGWGIWVRRLHGIVDDIQPEEVSQADAHLIAAAPELLQALRDLREACEGVYKAGRIQAEPFVRAGNVIAKAEGR